MDCNLYHLSPQNRQTEHSSLDCNCVDENGHSKEGYKSKMDAKRRADILWKETGRKLNIYCCPEAASREDCWHLTKKDPILHQATTTDHSILLLLDERVRHVVTVKVDIVPNMIRLMMQQKVPILFLKSMVMKYHRINVQHVASTISGRRSPVVPYDVTKRKQHQW